MSHFDLKYLEKLSRIHCSEKEEEELQKSIGSILDYIQRLSSINTSNVEPCRFVLQGISPSPYREDQIEKGISREKFLSNVPDQIGGMVRIPPVLKS